MNARTRSLLIIFAFVAGLVIVYGSQMATALFGDDADNDAYTYITDLDFWMKTDRETKIVSNARFDLDANLHDVPLTLGDWTGKEVEQTNEEVIILLDPEQYVQRLYQNSAGQYLWLSMIGGRSSQPFHAPDICYDADGWTYNLGSAPTELEGGSIYGLWMEAQKQYPDIEQPVDQIVYYFYLFPNEQRKLQDGIVLFKLTSGKYGSLEDTLKVHQDFVRQLFTAVRDN